MAMSSVDDGRTGTPITQRVCYTRPNRPRFAFAWNQSFEGKSGAPALAPDKTVDPGNSRSRSQSLDIRRTSAAGSNPRARIHRDSSDSKLSPPPPRWRRSVELSYCGEGERSSRRLSLDCQDEGRDTEKARPATAATFVHDNDNTAGSHYRYMFQK